MNIPESIKVGGINYKVEFVEHIPNEETGIQIGECDYFQATIKILDSLCVEKQEQTFIHELTHAIAYEAGIDEQDEDLINRFALVAYQVVKDNDFSESYVETKEGRIFFDYANNQIEI